MFKVEFDIVHKGCWGSEINLIFPKLAFSSIDCRWVGQRVAHLLSAEGDSSFFPAVVKYLKSRKDVSKVETLSRDGSRLYLRVLTGRNKRQPHFSNVFFSHHCFPFAPTRFEGECEIWTLGTSDKKNFAIVYSLLKKRHYPVRVKYLKNEGFGVSLTQKQREALLIAKHSGYYFWPRRKSATAIAQLLGVPKTVFLSHLRKAENKMLNDFSQ